MMQHTTVQALGQARLADLHDQARNDALDRAARRSRRARRQQAEGLLRAALAVVARRTRRPGPAPGSL